MEVFDSVAWKGAVQIGWMQFNPIGTQEPHSDKGNLNIVGLGITWDTPLYFHQGTIHSTCTTYHQPTFSWHSRRLPYSPSAGVLRASCLSKMVGVVIHQPVNIMSNSWTVFGIFVRNYVQEAWRLGRSHIQHQILNPNSLCKYKKVRHIF